jgi:hypothetical protein
LGYVLETEELQVLGTAVMVEDPSGPPMVVVVASSYVDPVKVDDPDETAPVNAFAFAWPLAAVNTSQNLQAVVPCAVDLLMVYEVDAPDLSRYERGVVVPLAAVKLDQNSKMEVVGACFGDSVTVGLTDLMMRVEQVVSLNLARVIIERRLGAKGYQAHQADTTALQRAVQAVEEPLETSCLKGLSAVSELVGQVREEHLSLAIYCRSCAKSS